MNNEVLKSLSYGVYAVTANINNRPTGCIANSIIQVTHNTVIVSLNHNNFTNLCIAKSHKFAISILGENIDNDIIATFGYKSGEKINKFEKIKSIEINGLNIIDGAVGYLICEVIDKMETETHTLFLGKIINGDVLNNNEHPMTYEYYHRVRKGKSPKNAPTYIDEKPLNKLSYKCSVCGYIYNGDINNEPEDYVCPICKQPKSVFVKNI